VPLWLVVGLGSGAGVVITSHRADIPPHFDVTSPEDAGRGHIGWIVAGSLLVGLAAAVVLDAVAFAGAREHVITGTAMLSFATGWALLRVLSGRWTDQPQHWATVPALYMATVGAALLVFKPGDSTLHTLGWIWPLPLLVLVIWMVRGSRRQLRSRTRPLLLYPVFAFLALAAVGGGVETTWESATTIAQPAGSRMVDVGGHSLYIRCVGSGSPTVVLENGLGEHSLNWAWVMAAVAPETRVCAYDRAGQGWSETAAGPQDGIAVATDLHTLLARANEPGPYVLAGHSTGGAYALTFAARYPSDVAGMVLLDSASPEQFALPDYPSFYSNARRIYALLPSLARTGLARVTLGTTSVAGLPGPERAASRAFASTARDLRNQRDEFSELPKVFQQAKALTDLAGKPLIVVTAGSGAQTGWQAAQDKLATLSTDSTHRTSPDISHTSLLEDRADAVNASNAIRDVVHAIRTGRRVTP
jgi:pimeloyl-ACP methyl ester carboxylesterase